MSAALVVVGARGRMGRRLVALAPEYGFEVLGAVDTDEPLTDSHRQAAVVIDFSVAAQAQATLRWCAEYGVGLVLGTTGLSAADDAALEQAATQIPIVRAANFSLGVHVLAELVAEAARLLDWDVELVEAHHRKKVDAPSGTALLLAERVAAARGVQLSDIVRHGRDGLVGARPAGELGIHAVRGGSVVGEHALGFYGDGEVITLEHRALDRDIFVRGALRSASWLARSPRRTPGRYGLADVLAR